MTPDLIVQIIVLSLIILVPLALWGYSPSKWAVIGCVLYTASYFVSNLWQLAFWLIPPVPPEAMEIIVENARRLAEEAGEVYVEVTLPPTAYGFALRLYQAGTLLLVVAYCAIVFYALMSGVKADIQARLVWLVLLIAEGFSVLEYTGCKMLVDPFGSGDYLLSQIWGIETSRFACGRAFSIISPYMAPIITTLYLLWVIKVGRSNDQEDNRA